MPSAPWSSAQENLYVDHRIEAMIERDHSMFLFSQKLHEGTISSVI